MDIKELNLNSENPDFEMKHWWITTRFRYLSKIIDKNKSNLKLIEYGCGTGNNVKYLRETYNSSLANITGIDIALPDDYKPKWLNKSDTLIKDYGHDNKNFNLLIAMDVIEHLENPKEIVGEWVENLPEGAVVFITVPAFQSLWSYHDEYMGHFKRYTRESLEELCSSLGLKKIKTTYAFGWAYPIIYFLRKIMKTNKMTSDFEEQNFILNFIFKFISYVEFKLGGNKFLGSSVIGYFKK